MAAPAIFAVAAALSTALAAALTIALTALLRALPATMVVTALLTALTTATSTPAATAILSTIPRATTARMTLARPELGSLRAVVARRCFGRRAEVSGVLLM